MRKKVENKQEVQKKNHDIRAKEIGFQKNSKVRIRDYRGKNRWTQGEIVEQTRPVSYRVNADGYIWNRHAEQLRNDETGRVTNSETTTNMSTEDEMTTSEGPTRNSRPPERLTYFRLGELVIN